MGIDHNKDLLKFLKPFEKEKVELFLLLREMVWNEYPQTNELIYDNYSAVAIGWSPTDRLGHTFCSMALIRSNSNVHFGFYWGNELSDTKKILLGKGNQYRYILVADIKNFPTAYIKTLLREGYLNSLKKIKDEKQVKSGLTIVKSISEKKRDKTITKAKKKK